MTIVPRDAPVLTAAQMRAAERTCFGAGTAQSDLMERAATAISREVARLAFGGAVLVLAGPGNNGGDAFAAARLLAASGIDVMVAKFGEPRGAAAAMRDRWGGATIAIEDATPRPVLVDGLFGIGLSRPIDPVLAAIAGRLSAAADLTVAIDLPSGMASDADGDVAPAARADVTLALGALKPAHVVGDRRDACGHVLFDGIGLSLGSDIRTIGRPSMSSPGARDHKYRRGLVAVVAGTMGGAARLAANAAAHGGAGYCVLLSDDARVPCDSIVRRQPDDLRATLDDDRTRAIVIGCGLGRSDSAGGRVSAVVASGRPAVIDGDALALIRPESLSLRTAPTILTPHSGEFDRLFGDDRRNRIDRTVAAAERSGAVVVHKGADTVIAAPDGRVVIAHPPAWLSTAGTGDVLAGLIGARLAVSGDAMRAAIAGVWLHARAARLAGPAFVADSLAMHIPAAIAECL